MSTIQLKRGSGVPGVALAAGEPAFDTTNKRLYVGDGATNTVIGPVTGLAITPSSVVTTGDITASGLLKAGSGPTTHTDAAGKILSVALNTVAVAQGGTGLATLTANNVILGNGTSAPSFVAPSTSGNVLTSNGTTWTSAAAAGGGITNSAGANVVPISDGTNLVGGADDVISVVQGSGTTITTVEGAITLTDLAGTNGVTVASNASGNYTEIKGATISLVGNVGIGTATPQTTLDINGGFRTVTAAKSGNYTLTTSDSTIYATTGVGGITITLPAASANTIGLYFFVYKVDSGVGLLTLTAAGTNTINGLASKTIANQWNGVLLRGQTATSWIATSFTGL